MNSLLATVKLRDSIAYFFLGVILLAIYSCSLVPGTGYTDDTVKFQFAGYVLGTPHPPGYPLYMFLNYLFTHLYPAGTLAYRANLLSAICAVATCLVMMRLVRNTLRFSMQTAFFTALISGLTPTFWSQAVVAEVYSLMMLFVLSTAYCVLQWHTTRNDKYLYSGALIYGLSFSHHLLMITLLPALVYLAVITDRSVFYRPKWLFFFTLCVLAGLAPYTYLLWRSYAGAPFLETYVRNIPELVDCITGRKFKSSMFQLTPSIMIYLRIPHFIALFAREYHIVWPVIFYGFSAGLRRMPHIRRFLWIACAGNIIFALGYNISDIFVYLLPTCGMLAIIFSAGFESIAKRCSWGRYPCAVSAIGIMITIVSLSVGYPLASQRGAVSEARLVSNIISHILPGSIIITPNYFAFHCFQYHTVGYDLQHRKQIYTTNQYLSPEELYQYLRNRLPVSLYKNSHGYMFEPGSNIYFTTLTNTNMTISKQGGDHFIGATRRALIRIDDFFREYGMAVVPQTVRKSRAAYEIKRNSSDEYLEYLQQITDAGLRITRVTECLYKIE